MTLENRENFGNSRPRIAITMGDPAGIGPEIVVKALADRTILEFCRPLIVGDAKTIRKIAVLCGLGFHFTTITRADEIAGLNDEIAVFDCQNITEEIQLGEETAVSGRASAEYIEIAVGLWQRGLVDAIATAPISKAAIHLGGYDYPGHTEFLAELTETKEFAMSFFAEKLRVVLLSTHVSLRDAIDLIKKDRLVGLIRFSHREFSRLLGRSARIAVAGLNPHASEGGMFGSEEADEISPAILECREVFGLDISGPFSPDTIFLRGYKGEFDAVVACYHDQATIAVKCLSFGASVNVTIGLPLIRTSVDHGTAFDIAGKNLAESSSMTAAIRLAAQLARSDEA